MKKRRPKLKKLENLKIKNKLSFDLKLLKTDFKIASDNLIWQLREGGGYENIHLSRSLENITTLNAKIRIYLKLLRSLSQGLS